LRPLGNAKRRDDRRNREEGHAVFRKGRVKPVVDIRFPLQKAADAVRRMESNEYIGKIVLIGRGTGIQGPPETL
jgi:NADPH:quinone reductase-like Zn-dependent oxidoreductase